MNSAVRQFAMKDASLMILSIDVLINGETSTKVQVLGMLEDYFKLEDIENSEMILKSASWVIFTSLELIDHLIELLEDISISELVYKSMLVLGTLLQIGEVLKEKYDNYNPIKERILSPGVKIEYLEKVQYTNHSLTYDVWTKVMGRYFEFL